MLRDNSRDLLFIRSGLEVKEMKDPNKPALQVQTMKNPHENIIGRKENPLLIMINRVRNMQTKEKYRDCMKCKNKKKYITARISRKCKHILQRQTWHCQLNDKLLRSLRYHDPQTTNYI